MKKPFYRLLVRPTPAPSLDLPFGVRSVGHYRILPGYRGRIVVKHFVDIIWGIAGTGALIINGEERWVRPAQIAIYLPGMRHEIYALDTEWEFCWWTMDGPLAANITTAFGLTSDVYDAGPAPRPLFRHLERTIRNPSPVTERQANAIAYQLLTIAATGRRIKSEDRLASEAMRIIHNEWNQPQLCVKQVAERLHLHRSSFTRRFEEAVGIPPVVYLNRLRVQNALYMLKQTKKSIAEVAIQCGFNDPHYFARLIHNITGLSPRSFRNDFLPKSGPAVPARERRQTSS